MKKGLALAGFGLLMTIASAAALAQTSLIPFHATIQRVQQVFGLDGALESEQTIIDDYTRNSEGSTYTESTIRRPTSLTGQVMTTSMRVIENANYRQTYLIDEDKKTILVSSSMFNPKQFRPPSGGKRTTYLGRTCVVLTNAQMAGELWMDVELGYPLYDRHETWPSGGRRMVRTSKVTDLTVGQEPDPNLFSPPSLDGYQVIQR